MDSSPTFNRYAKLVALPHSVFALPFALASFLLARRVGDLSGPLSRWALLWVVLAVVSARTAAMGFNRLVDVDVDAKNPRTKNRELPTGQLTKKSVFILVIGTSVLFLFFSALLGVHCLKLAPFVLAILLGYSFTKRFTKYSHFVLGLCLALAPGGAWWVVRPEVALTPLLLMATVLFWVAGFDILYSTQDLSFDKEHNLFSFPARIGLSQSLRLSTVLHGICVLGFVLVGVSVHLPVVYFVGVGILSLFLIGQHFLISENDLSRLNHAFFTFNGVTSICYLLLVIYSLNSI